MAKKKRSRSQKVDASEREPKLGKETYSALMLLNESCGSLDEALRILQQQKAIELVEVRYYRAMVQELRASRYFTRHARDTRWLQWISSTESFNAMFVPGAALSETSAELAEWFAEYFAIPHFAIAIEVVREKNQTLSPFLRNAVAQAFHRHAASGAPLRLWVPILLGAMPVNGHSDFLAYMKASVRCEVTSGPLSGRTAAGLPCCAMKLL